MSKTRIKYKEGQWFAVPLRDGGYTLGIIVRGGYRTKGGLGYFFGPRYSDIPIGKDTFSKNKENALFICQFGDLGIITGVWPIISDGKPFQREEWPVPLFYREAPLQKGKIVIVEYSQDFSGLEFPIRETVALAADQTPQMAEEGLFGQGAVEIVLTRLLKNS